MGPSGRCISGFHRTSPWLPSNRRSDRPALPLWAHDRRRAAGCQGGSSGRPGRTGDGPCGRGRRRSRHRRFRRSFERAGQDVAFRPADRGVAPGQPVVVASVDLPRPRQVPGHVGPPHAEGDPDHVHPPLLGDVAERRHPHVAVVPCRSEIDVDAQVVQRRPGEGHVVLPAHQPAEPAEGRVEHDEPRAVALAPHEPLGAGGHQLAVPAEQRPVRARRRAACCRASRGSRSFTPMARYTDASRAAAPSASIAGPGTSTAWS